MAELAMAKAEKKSFEKKKNAERLPLTTTVMLDGIVRRIMNCSPSTSHDKVIMFDELKEICLRSRELLLVEPPFLEVGAPVYVLGDLHGQLFDLQKMLIHIGTPPRQRFLFMGDYVDRGSHSIETITLLLALKLRCPKHIFLLRGNHETRCVNRQYGFYDECQRKFPGQGIELWTLYQHVFNCLPIAARIASRIFVAHGGISEDLASFDQFSRVIRPTDICDIGLLCDLIWSDPSPNAVMYSPSPRGVSSIFGKQAVTAFCHTMNIELIVRAHQCVLDGYEFFADRKCVTIFSAPCYCGEVDNLAGILYVSRKLECRVLTYRSDRTARGGGVIPVGGKPLVATFPTKSAQIPIQHHPHPAPIHQIPAPPIVKTPKEGKHNSEESSTSSAVGIL